MTDAQYLLIMARLSEIETKVRVIEANSRPAASTVQPLVRPPDVVQGEPAAFARPGTLSEIVTLLKFMLTEEGLPVNCVDVRYGWSKAVQFILQRLEGLDQGPIASKLTEESLLRMVSNVRDSDGFDV